MSTVRRWDARERCRCSVLHWYQHAMVLRSRGKATTRVSIAGGSGVSRRGGGRRLLRLVRSGLRPASPTRSNLAVNVSRTKWEHLTVLSTTEVPSLSACTAVTGPLVSYWALCALSIYVYLVLSGSVSAKTPQQLLDGRGVQCVVLAMHLVSLSPTIRSSLASRGVDSGEIVKMLQGMGIAAGGCKLFGRLTDALVKSMISREVPSAMGESKPGVSCRRQRAPGAPRRRNETWRPLRRAPLAGWPPRQPRRGLLLFHLAPLLGRPPRSAPRLGRPSREPGLWLLLLQPAPLRGRPLRLASRLGRPLRPAPRLERPPREPGLWLLLQRPAPGLGQPLRRAPLSRRPR